MAQRIEVDLPDSVTVADGEGGLPALRVGTPAGSGEIYLHGAHVTAWTPAGESPVIWMSRKSMFASGQPIRGGVPICFPWFGPGRQGDMSPVHGFARLADWTVTDAREGDDGVAVTLRLTDADVAGVPGAELWTHRFEATYTVAIGPELRLGLTIRNTDDEEYGFEEALHTYLQVADVRSVTVDGLDGAEYLDKTRDGTLVTQQGAVTFTGETDRVYRSTAPTTVHDAARVITVARSDSANTVVWNPWIAKAAAMPDYDDDEWPTMVCVEAANVLDDALRLAPGQGHTLSTRISVARG